MRVVSEWEQETPASQGGKADETLKTDMHILQGTIFQGAGYKPPLIPRQCLVPPTNPTVGTTGIFRYLDLINIRPTG